MMKPESRESSGIVGQILHFFLGEVRGWLIGGAIFGIGVWVVAFPIFERRNTERLEAEQAPLIAKLEQFKSKNGKYPDRLDALVPDYLSELPPCPISRRPAYVVDEKSGDYELICPTFVFSTRTYTPGTKTWRPSMD